MKLDRYWVTPWDWGEVPRPFVHADWSDYRTGSFFVAIGIGHTGSDNVWAREWSATMTRRQIDGLPGRIITWFGRRW